MNLNALKRLILRAFPGLSGYHCLRYGRVTGVVEGSGTHSRQQPLCAVHCDVLDSQMQRDSGWPSLVAVPLATPTAHLVAPPPIGAVVLLGFAYWQANAPVVLACLYEGRTAQSERDAARIGDDHLVLADVLIEKLEDMGDLLLSLGESGNQGAPLGNYATASTQWATLKTTLAQIKARNL